MAVWSQLMTVLGGATHEADGSIIDSQTLRILDQEIRDADAHLRKSKESLADIIVKEKEAGDDQASAVSKILAYEGYAMKALDGGDEVLALDVATKIAGIEAAREQAAKQLDYWVAKATRLRQSIEQAQTHITRLKQQADTVKATKSVQRAQATVAERYCSANSRAQTALDSLVRVQQKSTEKSTMGIETIDERLPEGAEDALEVRLRTAGIATDALHASAILARLKASKAAHAPMRDTP